MKSLGYRRLRFVVAAALFVGIAIVVAEALESVAARPQDSSGSNGAIPVEIVSTGEARYTLLRGGTPYLIKGAGLHLRDLESFAAHGGNSIRTWTTDGGQEVLDAAHKRGITVIMCIDIGRERLGFDYDNPAAVTGQLEFARQEVIKYKDHPALLAWMIGNEPDMKFTNPKVFDAINDISRMIHEVDGNHPTTTALAQFRENGRLVETRAPDLDFISIQMYKGILNLPHFIEETGLRKPYLVTEYGGVGFWKPESEWTSWGAPIELNSSAKAEHFRLAYRTAIASEPGQIAGSYVFLWGHKQERTPTWFGFLLADGSYTENVEVAHTIWNGAGPDNTAPRIAGITLDGKVANQDVVLASGQRYGAEVLASDGENDALSYRWILKRESTATQDGGDVEEIPEEIVGRIGDGDDGKASLDAPEQAGAYRLFVYVHDGGGYAGYANIPFLVR